MPVTPTGILSVPPSSLRTSLSTLSSVQTFLDVANSTLALAKIYEVAKPATALSGETAWGRPFILVSEPQEIGIHQGGFANGSMLLMFERAVPEAYRLTYLDAQRDFTNLVGAVLMALPAALNDGSETLVLQTPIRTNTSPMRSELDAETGDYMQCSYWLDYGPRMAY